MWCCLHFRSMCNHVFGSKELHIKHVFEGNVSLPKNCNLFSSIFYELTML